MKKLLWFVLINTLVLGIWAGSLRRVYNVPSDAQPGHIVAIMNLDYNQVPPTVDKASGAGYYFSVLNGGELIVTSDLSAFSGQSLKVTLVHKLQDDIFNENIDIKIAPENKLIAFENQPYIGYISENQPINTIVYGLQSISDALNRLPYGCIIKAESGGIENFQVIVAASSLKVMSKVSFDRELQDSYYFMMRASCTGYLDALALVRIMIVDENDNKPLFQQDIYYFQINSLTLNDMNSFGQVKANDKDLGDSITYHLQNNDYLFSVDERTGVLYYNLEKQSLASGSFSMNAIATDNAGNKSPPVQIFVEIYNEQDNAIEHHRKRRAAALLPQRIFVIRTTERGNLFTVASYPLNADERFTFIDPSPVGLELDYVTGMVTLVNTSWSSFDPIYFNVNITYISNINSKLLLLLSF